MSESCPTVKVKFDNEDGFIIINKSDFNPDTQELLEEKQSIADVRLALATKGVEIPEGAKKAELLALLEAGK